MVCLCFARRVHTSNERADQDLVWRVLPPTFRRGQHLAFDRSRNYPLPNLFVSVLQRLGIEAASFGPSTGTVRGLEVA